MVQVMFLCYPRISVNAPSVRVTGELEQMTAKGDGEDGGEGLTKKRKRTHGHEQKFGDYG